MRTEDLLEHEQAVWEACSADPGLWNIVQAEREWRLYGDACDPLSPSAPEHQLKLFQRDLYLSAWREPLALLAAGARALVAGGGTGRFAQVLIERGLAVDLVDASREAITRARRHLGPAAHAEVGDLNDANTLRAAAYDLVLAVEVPCYVTDPARVLRHLAAALRPGATLLFSVEARPGALLADGDLASPAAMRAVLDDGVVTLPGSKHVHYYSRDEARALAAGAGLEVRSVEGVCYVPDGPFGRLVDATRLRDAAHREELIEMERRCREHPALRELPRAWAVHAVAAA